MPLEEIRGSFRVFENSLRGSLQKVGFEHLQVGCDCASKYVQGTVAASYPLSKVGNGTSFFKIILQESENPCSKAGAVNTYMFGKLAEDCASVVHQGDIMVVAGFSVSKSTSEADGHCCRLEVSDEAGSTIYIKMKRKIKSRESTHQVCTRSSNTITGSETVAMSVAPSYTYTPLNLVKGGTIVNLYGAVKFFKPPYKCKGTDYCSVITIVDQSDAKLICSLFNVNRDALPQIYKNGDIVRFHRIKIKEFSGQLQGISSSGFAALTFDGTVGTPVVPRTSSKLFTFTDEDRKTIEDLRIWVASNLLNSAVAAKLSGIQPPMYFDLTCQLVGKAKLDGSSYLLKVWDGTKCPFLYWKVVVREDDFEGDSVLIHRLRNLTVDVVVYDNHVQLAKSLKVGSFIRLYSLHAKFQSPEDEPDVSYLQFHLHGGTTYGRGITSLPEGHADVEDLKKFLNSVDLMEDESSESPSEPENAYFTLGSCSEGCQQLSVTVLRDHQHFEVTALSTILNSRSPQPYRIRAKLRQFEPEKLHQSVKLHCPQCKLLQEVPDGSELDLILQEASATCPRPDLQNTSFCESVVWDTENQGQRRVVIHFVKHDELLQDPEDSLIMIEGGTLEEILKLSKKFKGIIPVRAMEDDLELLDLSAPFLWQGNIPHYGCKHCSNPKAIASLSPLAAQKDPLWEPTTIAQALGLVPLEYVFVMKFMLDDGTGTLNVYLMDCKDFFQIPASEVLTNNIFQENIERIMNKLCPSGTNLDDLPWLDCFIKSYYVTDGREQQICYRVFDTTIAEDV
ncbi:protection of telomeres protein 1 isoform X1 [Podarcis lilfordi]|uniref:Protection of telomeres protein 1 n=1 Tax=Podarcis lilfordi TaxID=74358 RepID=A0AA35PGR6_9SAUR|nr:protection of telomeres protein 1 isoform X1 [Podarcis lilfordi]